MFLGLSYIPLHIEAKLEVSHHELRNGEWENAKELVFVLDEVQPKKVKTKGGKAAPQITSKNFGQWISITKLKTCSDTLQVVWRCRWWFDTLPYLVLSCFKQICM